MDAYWRRDEEHEWKNSLRFTAGDAFGATPAVVSLFNEEPAVIAQRMMHFAADTLGTSFLSLELLALPLNFPSHNRQSQFR